MSALGRVAALVAAAHDRVAGSGRHRTYGVLQLADGEPHLQPPYVAVLALSERAGANLSPGADLSGPLDSRDGLGRSASELHAPSPTVQRVEAVLGVVCCVAARRRPAMRQLDDDAAPRRDGDPDERLEALIAATRGVLLGWLPDPAWWPLELSRGRLLSAQDGRAHWQDEYRAAYLLSGGGEIPAEAPGLPAEICVSVDGGAPTTVAEP